jgi:hypothetical protein
VRTQDASFRCADGNLGNPPPQVVEHLTTTIFILSPNGHQGAEGPVTGASPTQPLRLVVPWRLLLPPS